MPDPNAVSSGANGSRVDFASAPGADMSFDDLFPPSEGPASQPQAAPGTPPPSTPQAASQPFLKAGDSVYLSAEDAARGIEHKDQLVARYRTFLQENGFDPNDPHPKAATQTNAPAAEPSQYKYYKTGKLYDALATALSTKNVQEYERIQTEHAREAAQDEFTRMYAPYAPLMAETARQRAFREVSKEIPDFNTFYGSDGYKAVTSQVPLIHEMELIGESNPEAAKRLPELYKMAYLVHQGLNRTQAPVPALNVPPVQNSPTARPQTPTLSPSSLTPPAPGIDTRGWERSQGNGRSLNSDARKQLIRDFESKGTDNLDWNKVGY